MTIIPVIHPITRLIVGGAQENTMYTAEMLDRTRYQVEILSGPQTGSEGSLIGEVRDRNIPLFINPHLIRQINPVHDFRALWQMKHFFQERNFTIVHTHSSKAGILGRFAAKLADVPNIVHTVHGWSFHDYMSPLLRMLYIQLERWAAKYTDALIVVSQRDIDKGLQAGIGYTAQYHLIRSAIPLDVFDPAGQDPVSMRKQLGIKPESIVIGNVGRFSPQKNPFEWVRIAGEIARRHPDIHFLLIGDGPLKSEVEQLIKEENIYKKTTLTGLRRDVASYLSVMDIFMITSLWEGLPRVIPQAMAMEVPVVAYRADGTIEAIEDGKTGFLSPPGDLHKMVELCQLLIAHTDKRRIMGQNGRAYASKEFDLTDMIISISSLYESLLSTKRNNH